MGLFKHGKQLPAKERLKNSQKQLKEFINTPNENKLSEYEHLLCPAISRIYSIVHTNILHDYNKIDLLNADFLYSDIRVIPYYSEKRVGAVYIPYKSAVKLPYPTGEYEILESSIGKCRDEESGRTFFSPRIAVDTSIEAIAQRWLDNIPVILEML